MNDKDLFKQDFKYYKRKNPLPNFDSVIDFDLCNKFSEVLDVRDIQLKLTPNEKDCSECEKLGLRNHRTWELYSIKGLDGFFYLKNIFTVTGQQTWIRKCLELYPEKPSVTNLDVHYADANDIWSLRNHTDPEKRNYLDKLCWATLGYHHNWDTKVYDPDHSSEFPPCLHALSKHIARCLGFASYQPEAAIVNYYHMKSYLSIHNDHSEEDTVSPIISFSFGQTGLFLIGSNNRCDKSTAMFLRSGDVIIMSGPCRLSYHAVPLIIANNACDKYNDFESSKDWEPFDEYISKARINISVRQVYLNKS